MARPTKYTPETLERLAEGIRLGLTKELAASYAGISYDTLNDWEHGRKGVTKAQAVQLVQALQEADGKGAAVNMARIQKEAQEGEWRAAAWIMENRYGYAKPSKHEHTGEGGGDIVIRVIYAERRPDPADAPSGPEPGD